MRDDDRSIESLDSEDDVEAQMLKETLGAGLAVAAIFAGSTQAASYPVPSPPGTADAAAELATIPQRTQVNRLVQQATPRAAPKKAAKAKKVKKLAKTQRSSTRGGAGGGRGQPA